MARAHVASSLPPTPIERVFSPFSRFIRMEAAGGLVLIACTLAALAWANSPWADGYHHLWNTRVGFSAGPWSFGLTLHHWVNDGLMAVFFFLVGLEIKREGLVGELASPRRAALPAAAALGGMVVPAAFYALLNLGGEGARGWGIPMATDIAFALGVLALMGPRVPLSLKVFLTALAIADDIGAVVVIALFYTEAINWGALGLGLLLLGAGIVANRMGARRPAVYIVLGAAVWACFLASGVHATVAGVLVAMTIPVRTRIDEVQLLAESRRTLDDFEAACGKGPLIANQGQQAALLELETLSEAAQAPLQRIEHELQDVVAFGVVPLFALANAGVTLSGGIGQALANPVALGVLLGLVIGKPLGITLASRLVVRIGWAELPDGVTWRALHAVSWLGGIGFTMSLFIAALAFPSGALADVAKVGIFAASLAAGAAGWLLVRGATSAGTQASPGSRNTPDRAAERPGEPAAREV